MSDQPEPTLVELFLYNHWANQELLKICLGLSEELVTTNIPGAYGSIRATFAHILKAESSFLKRIHGRHPEPGFQWESDPGLAQMAEYESALHTALLDTLQHVPATRNVHEEGQGWMFDYQARLIFMSVVYHGIAHRTDITTALHHKGLDLPELDVWGYQAAHPERFQARVSRPGQ